MIFYIEMVGVMLRMDENQFNNVIISSLTVTFKPASLQPYCKCGLRLRATRMHKISGIRNT